MIYSGSLGISSHRVVYIILREKKRERDEEEEEEKAGVLDLLVRVVIIYTPRRPYSTSILYNWATNCSI